MSKIGELTVNDGNGLFDNAGLCDTLIVDLNTLVKDMSNGQYVHFCITVTHMIQKLQNLKSGIVNELDGKDKTIEQLKVQLKALGEDVKEYTPSEIMEKLKKDGADNGAN